MTDSASPDVPRPPRVPRFSLVCSSFLRLGSLGVEPKPGSKSRCLWLLPHNMALSNSRTTKDRGCLARSEICESKGPARLPRKSESSVTWIVAEGREERHNPRTVAIRPVCSCLRSSAQREEYHAWTGERLVAGGTSRANSPALLPLPRGTHTVNQETRGVRLRQQRACTLTECAP